ncbi:shikimate dehydrogenase [Tuberibacillus sp. Marseille-P3662]|uniref:shikimate dehydrogenase n=1 Tax=Tuberibacillus sp. Marseille-P3662 TaxID=1965358 RepID=UPI000A1CF0F8|nr:shikimate dehydrogenase [Tuberibacillus sp. Marseille-P3662]
MKIFGVMGDPISHSLSPIMHNTWFRKYEMDHHYHAFQVSTNGVHDAMKGIKALSISGMNVTIPHKVSVIPYLDHIDDEAAMLGAVNTIIHRDGKLYGENTDGLGFLASLKTKYPNYERLRRVLIIGAGGASRAVGLTLSKHLSDVVDYANRTVEKAQSLAVETRQYGNSKGISILEAETQIHNYDMVINCTPMGMDSVNERLPIQLDGVTPDTVIVDIVYRPLKTSWLQHAEHQGCTIIGGLPMLIHQGALAFQDWLGFMPEVARVERLLQSQLGDSYVDE